MNLTRPVAVPVLLLCVLLAGCTSKESDLSTAALAKDIVAKIRASRQQARTPDLAPVSAKALQRTDRRLAEVTLPSVKAGAVVQIIESNGPYDTWAAWGVSDRRTITTKRGIVTATRAIAPDLMSADVDGVLRLVTQREEGTAQYVQRYLDGNHGIVEAKSTCVVSRGYDKHVQLGEIDRPALQMFSSCVSADRQFVDLYLVDERGRILQSRQWLGPGLGFVVMRQLR